MDGNSTTLEPRPLSPTFVPDSILQLRVFPQAINFTHTLSPPAESPAAPQVVPPPHSAVAAPARKPLLAQRIEALLQAAAGSLGFASAAVYLLRGEPPELVLEAAWNLPPTANHAPSRPLASSLADLEALCGHAVALESSPAAAAWNPPLNSAACLCLPVSSCDDALGTLWFFADRERVILDADVQLAETLAGRLALEVEKDQLEAENRRLARRNRDWLEAERRQRDLLPRIASPIDGWDLAAWTEQAAGPGGDFHDWFRLPKGRLIVAAGAAGDTGAAAALCAARLQTAVRAHSVSCRGLGRLFDRVNRTLYAGSASERHASLFAAAIRPNLGRVRYATAGDPAAILVRGGKWKSLARPEFPIGLEPATLFSERRTRLAPGDAMIVASDGIRDSLNARGRILGDVGIASAALDDPRESADSIAQAVRARFEEHACEPGQTDRTILVLRRVLTA